ncbi:YIP1 family protein [Priestia endophytica]|uniref:YIP1 family protein n=1 Tax=Priestia endophytica TaxID=135735 RepID=UPI00227D9D1E|nr:YIP1 family protein [Priestia endophytica]MCY8233162.1 YIP1 family protein [Priestia endophytica]
MKNYWHLFFRPAAFWEQNKEIRSKWAMFFLLLNAGFTIVGFYGVILTLGLGFVLYGYMKLGDISESSFFIIPLCFLLLFLIGTLIAFIASYIVGFFTKTVSKLIGGKVHMLQAHRKAYLFGMLTYLPTNIILLIVAILSTVNFLQNPEQVYVEQDFTFSKILIVIWLILNIVTSIWSLVVWSISIGKAEEMSAWKGLLGIIVMAIGLWIILMVAIFILSIAVIPFFS